MQADRSGEACSCPPSGPPRAFFNSIFGHSLQRGFEAVSGWDRLSVDRGHEAGISACRCRVDAGHPLGRESRDIMRTAGLRSGAAQAFSAKWLAFDHRADLVAIDVEVPDPHMMSLRCS